MDLFFRNNENNIRKICSALNEFGIQTSETHIKEFAEPGVIIRLGLPPVRLKLINTISGVSFSQVWNRRVKDKYGETSVCYISIDDLLKNKKESATPKDLVDFDELGGNRKS